MEDNRSLRLREFVVANMQKLPYHNPSHALDVAETAVKLAVMEGRPSSELSLLYSAGLTHDLVYHIDAAFGAKWGENEEKSAVIAGLIMPRLGYSNIEVSETQRLIRATSFPIKEKPADILEAIIRDADIANTGREDFWENTKDIRREVNMQRAMKGELPITDEEYAAGRADFLQNKVQFNTKAARDTYNRGLARNIDKALDMVSQYK